jgi:hypothetical protein
MRLFAVVSVRFLEQKMIGTFLLWASGIFALAAALCRDHTHRTPLTALEINSTVSFESGLPIHCTLDNASFWLRVRHELPAIDDNVAATRRMYRVFKLVFSNQIQTDVVQIFRSVPDMTVAATTVPLTTITDTPRCGLRFRPLFRPRRRQLKLRTQQPRRRSARRHRRRPRRRRPRRSRHRALRRRVKRRATRHRIVVVPPRSMR